MDANQQIVHRLDHCEHSHTTSGPRCMNVELWRMIAVGSLARLNFATYNAVASVGFCMKSYDVGWTQQPSLRTCIHMMKYEGVFREQAAGTPVVPPGEQLAAQTHSPRMTKSAESTSP